MLLSRLWFVRGAVWTTASDHLLLPCGASIRLGMCLERTDLLQQRWTDCPWGNSVVRLSHPAPALSVSSEFSVLPTEPGHPVCSSKDLRGGHSLRAEPRAWGQAPPGCVLTGRQDTWHPSHSPLLWHHLYFPFVNSLYLDVTSSSVSC